MTKIISYISIAVIALIVVFLAVVLGFGLKAERDNVKINFSKSFVKNDSSEALNSGFTEPVESAESSESAKFAEPVESFKDRITLKSFGEYITPENSPVENERFSGYHTGVDVEFADVQDEISVKAISSGEIAKAEFVSGYGGVVVLKTNINNENVFAIYGHVSLDKFPKVGSFLAKGQTIGILGEGSTVDTDFERKHLHFGIYKGEPVDLHGYVSKKSELTKWVDPTTLYE